MKILNPLPKIQSKSWVHLNNPHENNSICPQTKLPITVRTPQTKIMSLPLHVIRLKFNALINLQVQDLHPTFRAIDVMGMFLS